MKNIFFIIFIFISLTSFGQKITWIPFKWDGGEVSGKHFDKLAMKIPVIIDNLDYNFDMQLDLGAVTTTIYGVPFQEYLNIYPKIKSKIDTTLQFTIQGKKNFKLKNIDLKLGGASFGKQNIGLFKDFGKAIPKDSLFTKSKKHIGTIAPDLFQEKILIIDFPNQKIAVVNKKDDLPENFAEDIQFKLLKRQTEELKYHWL